MFILIKSHIGQVLLPKKLMQIMLYDLQNAMFQIQDLSLFTGSLVLFCLFPYKTIDKYLYVLTFFQIEKICLAIKITSLPLKS